MAKNREEEGGRRYGRVDRYEPKDRIRAGVLERLKGGEIQHRHARQLLGLSRRQSQRLKKRYAANGTVGISHRGRGAMSNRKINGAEIKAVLKIVEESYRGFGPTLAYEKRKEKGEITFSLEILRRSMIDVGLWKPRKKRNDYVHQARERRPCFGELIQVDGSLHKWFEERGPMCTLLAYIDDATSSIVYAKFVKSESTWSYFEATKQYFRDLGKPLALYPFQNETGTGCLSKSLWSHMRNMLPSRFEIQVSFWNGYRCLGISAFFIDLGFVYLGIFEFGFLLYCGTGY